MSNHVDKVGQSAAVMDVEKDENSALLGGQQLKQATHTPLLSNVPELRHTIAALLGPIADFYDFTIFAFVSGEIADAMFDYGSKQTRMMLVWTVFALGFIARAIGGFVFGRLGDIYGRARVLRWSLIMLAIGSLGIGMLPTVQQVGPSATFGLVLFRIIIGFTVACQYSEVSVMMSENSKYANESYHYRGSASSMICSVGTLLASATVECLRYSLSDNQMKSVGWRVPFIVSSLLTLLVYYLQMDMPESVEFAEQQKFLDQPEWSEDHRGINDYYYDPTEPINGRNNNNDPNASKSRGLSEDGSDNFNQKSMLIVLEKNIRSFMVIFFCTAGVNFVYYVVLSWFVEEVRNEVPSGLLAVTIGLVLYVVSAIVGSTLADKYEFSLDGSRRWMIASYSMTSVVFCVTLWLYVSHPQQRVLYFWVLTLSTVIPLGFTGALCLGFINSLVSDPTERSTVVVSAYSCEVALFGGFAPLVCQSMMASSLRLSGVALALICVNLISVIPLIV